MSLFVRLLAPLLLAAWLIHPTPAQAIAIAVQECSGPTAATDFSCTAAGDAVVAGSFAVLSNGIVLQTPNTYSVLNFAYADPGGLMTFTGTVMTTDILGQYIYTWGTGTATALIAGALGDSLDVLIGSNFVTAPGVWNFAEFLNWNCNAAAAAGVSAVAAQGAVNGNLLTPVGALGNCGGALPGSASAGPFAGTLTGVTNLTAAAQFFFNGAGGAAAAPPQTITLPWGDDYPDPGLSGLLPTPTDLSTVDADLGSSLALLAPEPALGWLTGFAVMSLIATRRRPRS